MGDDRTVGRAHLQQVRGQLIHLAVAFVADDQTLVRIEHAQALAHIAQGCLEPRVLGLDFRCCGFPLPRMPEMENRNHYSDRSQQCEEQQAHAVALGPDFLHESGHRHIDRKRAHDIVQPPLRFSGLELVVATHAALFTRQRRIDRAQHECALDGLEHGLGLRIGHRGESLYRFRHLGVCRWRRDVPSFAPYPAQAKFAFRTHLLVEAFDGVRPKGCRHRRSRSQLGSQARVFGDERVDQPQRSRFLVSLLRAVCFEAGLVEFIRNTRAERSREGHEQQQGQSGFRANEQIVNAQPASRTVQGIVRNLIAVGHGSPPDVGTSASKQRD